MIYTSYFGKTRKIPSSIVRVSICRITPAWYEGLEYKRLAPSLTKMLEYKKTNDLGAYKEYFMNDVLSIYNPNSLYANLKNVVGCDSDIVLLCYEKDPATCHRTFVREWFNENGIPCEEWDDTVLGGHLEQLKMDI